MNLAGILEYLGTSVSREKRLFDYTGDLTANTQAAYNAIAWNDSRPKPTWSDIVAAAPFAVKWHARRALLMGI